MAFEVVVVVDADSPQRLDRILVVDGDLLPYLKEARPGGPDRLDEEFFLAAKWR